MNTTPIQEGIDIFISYKHRRFYKTVKTLEGFLGELQVRTWLDQNKIAQNETLPRDELKRIIKTAVKKSRLTVFYETYDQLEIGHNSKPHTAFNWQIFERQYAKEVLFVIPKSSGFSYIQSPCRDELFYHNVSYLAYLLAITVDADQKIDEYWIKYFSIFPRSTAEIYHIHKFHDLPEYMELPRIIDPKKPYTAFSNTAIRISYPDVSLYSRCIFFIALLIL